MARKIGTVDVVDGFIGDKLIEARYAGDKKYFDAYTTVTGTLPLTFNSRVAGALKNYRIYGDSDGAGVKTENLFVFETVTFGKYIDSNGVEQTGSSAGASTLNHTDYIEVEPSSDYVFTGFINPTTSIANTCALCWFDANKAILSRNVFNVSTSTVYYMSGTSPANAKYLIVNFIGYTNTMNSKFMVTQSSTAPTTYIPFGYKIPILCQSKIVTDNLFDKNATDANNGYVDGYHLINDGTTGSNSSWAISEYMPITGGLNLNYTFNYGSLSSSPAICYYDSDKHFISGVPYGGQSPKTVSVPQNISYIRFSFMKSYVDDIMFVQANSLPDHYIPHFYQSNYDLFIGDGKLYEDEYLDFVEQKVYKRTENLFDGNFEQGGMYGGSDRPPTDTNYYKRCRTIGYIDLEAQTEYTLVSSNYQIYCYAYKDGVYVSNQILDQWSKSHSISTSSSFNQIRFMIGNDDLTQGLLVDDIINDVMLVKGSTAPQSYIPYLQPTEPPAPLPAINAYQGENTLSSTETVGTVTVKGRISEVTPSP